MVLLAIPHLFFFFVRFFFRHKPCRGETPLFSPFPQEIDKMTMAQFVKNHRGIDQGHDPPREILEAMYKRIRVSYFPPRLTAFAC